HAARRNPQRNRGPGGARLHAAFDPATRGHAGRHRFGRGRERRDRRERERAAMTREPTPARAPLRVFIIDDHRSVLWGLERLVGSHKTRMALAGSATSATRALETLDAAKP